jgi:hypothetical protein
MKEILDKKIDKGGATNSGTIFQIIAVVSDLTVWLKAPGNFDWRKIELSGVFFK